MPERTPTDQQLFDAVTASMESVFGVITELVDAHGHLVELVAELDRDVASLWAALGVQPAGDGARLVDPAAAPRAHAQQARRQALALSGRAVTLGERSRELRANGAGFAPDAAAD